MQKSLEGNIGPSDVYITHEIAKWVLQQMLENPSIVQVKIAQKYVRFWSEVSSSKVNSRWFPYNKGGQFRRWYGNFEFLVNWENAGAEIKSEKNFCARGGKLFFLKWNQRFVVGFIFCMRGNNPLSA